MKTKYKLIKLILFVILLIYNVYIMSCNEPLWIRIGQSTTPKLITFGDDGKKLFIISDHLKIIDYKSFQLIQLIKFNNRYTKYFISNNRRNLIAARYNEPIFDYWDINEGKIIRSDTVKFSLISKFRMSNDLNKYIITDNEGKVNLYSYPDCNLLYKFFANSLEVAYNAEFSNDGKKIVIVSAKKLSIFSTSTYELISEINYYNWQNSKLYFNDEIGLIALYYPTLDSQIPAELVIFDIQTNNHLNTIYVQNQANQILYTGKKDEIIVTTGDGAFLWNLVNGSMKSQLIKNNIFLAESFYNDNTQILACWVREKLIIVDIKNSSIIDNVLTSENGKFIKDGEHIVLGNRVLDTRSLTDITTISTNHSIIYRLGEYYRWNDTCIFFLDIYTKEVNDSICVEFIISYPDISKLKNYALIAEYDSAFKYYLLRLKDKALIDIFDEEKMAMFYYNSDNIIVVYDYDKIRFYSILLKNVISSIDYSDKMKFIISNQEDIIFINSEDKHIYALKISDNSRIFLTQGNLMGITNDDKYLLIQDENFKIHLFDIESKVIIYTFNGYQFDGLSAEQSINGKYLLINYIDGTSALFEYPFISVKGNNLNSYNSLNLYPNPASDYIEVAVPTEQMTGDGQQLRIYNMLGQSIINYELRSTNNEARAKIDIRHLPAGLYYIRIGDKGLPFVKN